MTRLVFTPLDMYIQEEDGEEVKRIELPKKLITDMNIKDINPTGTINVEITLAVDEIDVEYSSVFKRRVEMRKKLRDELGQKA